jgi:hypothetical protein
VIQWLIGSSFAVVSIAAFVLVMASLRSGSDGDETDDLLWDDVMQRLADRDPSAHDIGTHKEM